MSVAATVLLGLQPVVLIVLPDVRRPVVIHVTEVAPEHAAVVVQGGLRNSRKT